MATALEHRQYSTLDGMRGVAAMSIVIVHTPHFFNWWHLPNSFLAVDLFFILSGFVLANAYESKFGKSLGVIGFFRLRFIRLYPLYLLSIALGIVIALLALRYGRLGVQWSPTLLFATLPLSVLMLPTPQLGPSDVIYPLNPVLWSIFFELIINVAYVALWRFFRKDAVLALWVAVWAALLVVYGVVYQSMDSGYSWATICGGLVRVNFSFFAGVLIYRRAKKTGRTANLAVLAILAATLVLFAYGGGIAYQLVCILVVFPAIVILAIRYEPSAGLQRWCAALGAASYAVYVIHKPLYQLLLGGMIKFLPFPPVSLSPWIGIGYMPLVLGLCLLLNRFYDVPFRRWMAVAWRPAVRSGPTAVDPVTTMR